MKLNDGVLAFGGWRSIGNMNSGYLDEINKYDIINNKWTKSEIKMPKKMIVHGAASILNQKFVTLFGAIGDDGVIGSSDVPLVSRYLNDGSSESYS